MIFHFRSRCASPRLLTVGFHLLMLAWAQPGAAQSVNADKAATLPAIEVDGLPQDEGLVPQRASAAMRASVPLVETPQSISVVTRAQMDAQDVHSVNEAFRYAPGIATEAWGGVSAYDELTIRGFTSTNDMVDTFLDGLRMGEGLVFGSQQIDAFLLERMEVLRGPASVLYGRANPGGVVVLTSKLPREQAIRRVELEGGSYGNRRASFDLGGAADASGTLLFRVVGTAMNSDGHMDGAPVRRRAVAPSLTWQPSAATRFTLYARYQGDPQSGMIGSLPAQGTMLPNPHGRLPMRFNTGEPSYDRFSRTQRAAGYQFDQRLADDWSLSLNGRYADIDVQYAAVRMTGLRPDLRTIDRYANASDERYNTLALDNQVRGRFATGVLQHELLAGISWEQLRGRGDFRKGKPPSLDIPSLDIFEPVYGMPIPAALPVGMDNRVRSTQMGFYLQDQLSLGGWHTMLGLRHDRSTIDTVDFRWRNDFTQHDRATTGRIGTLYRFENGLAPYATYAQSFQPINQLSARGTPFQPSRGELFEAGLKYQPLDWDALFTAALYNLTQANVLIPDPANPWQRIQEGEMRSRGLELEARARLAAQWSVIAAYTWQQVEYTKGSADIVGKRPVRVPAQFGGVWLAWDAPSGLGAALGARYHGGTAGGMQVEEFRTPSFTLLDAQLHYDFGRQSPSMKGARLQLNVANLTNKRHVAGCYDLGTGCFPGLGRQVNLTLAYQW
ncbi:TonB-dependent siderophore receptor [Achromobacter insuavis]|uniref:TonB-dependent siderophore receptor n=1 Tax=Achromobacter insuavis TaxID=1287735 RepID=UPI001F13863E|nr:TonB-dependent siderophore receptor [Achromobacter insuavis]